MITKFAAKTTTLGLIAATFGNNIQTGFSLSTVGKIIATRRTLWHPKQTVALSALSFAEPEEKKDESIIVSNWEEMYQKGEEARQQQIFAMKTPGGSADTTSIKDISPTIKAPVRIISFDLDNTLWKTGPTIGAANDALAHYLSTKTKDDGTELQIPTRVETVMGELFRADRRKYCPLVGATIPIASDDDDDEDIEELNRVLEETLKTPVALTQLRIDALCHVLETENGFSPETALSFSNDAFGVWTQARHDSILDHMAPRVVETLEEIRTAIQTENRDGRPVLLGAVTDGNSDPRNIEILAPYFDFCVNAEAVGVSKPDKRVYLEAIKKAILLRPDMFSDVLPTDEIIIGEDGNLVGIDSQILEDIVGPYWCHIGDDFLKDVVAAKDMKMRTIFAIGLVKDKLLANTTKSGDSEKEMDMAEFLKKVSSQTVVTLGIGADDYLANALHGEFVDEVAQDFSEIGRILIQWHKEASDSIIAPGATVYGEEKEQQPESNLVVQDEEQTVLEVIEPSSSTNTDGLPGTPIANKNQQGELNFLLPRAFRIIRGDCSVDIPAPLRKREERTMKEVMGLAQREKSSGVFAFDPADITSLNEGKKVLMIKIGPTDLEFSRDIFSDMSVEEVLGLTDENPLELFLFMAEASEQPSFDLF